MTVQPNLPSSPLAYPPIGRVIGNIDGRPSAVGTGLVALDIVFGLDQHCAPQLRAGGTCGNVLTALSFLGWNSYPIARLASDAAGRRVMADLAACGAHTAFVAMSPIRPTPIIVQRIRTDSEGRIVHRFSTRCPTCCGYLPQYQPVGRAAIETAAT